MVHFIWLHDAVVLGKTSDHTSESEGESEQY